jgi:hypothetical protein
MAATIAAALEVAVNNRQAELLAAENARKIRELSLLQNQQCHAFDHRAQ